MAYFVRENGLQMSVVHLTPDSLRPKQDGTENAKDSRLHYDADLLVSAVEARLQISAVGKALNRGTRG